MAVDGAGPDSLSTSNVAFTRLAGKLAVCPGFLPPALHKVKDISFES